MRIIVIDDERTFSEAIDPVRYEHAEYARDEESGIIRLWNQLFISPFVLDELWLDHDLGRGGTIRTIVEGLIYIGYREKGSNIAPSINTIYLHTANAIGGDWMEGALKPYWNCVRIYNAPDAGLVA